MIFYIIYSDCVTTKHLIWLSRTTRQSQTSLNLFVGQEFGSGSMLDLDRDPQFNFFFGGGGIFSIFFVLYRYSALLHLPPLRFHCADGCWDRTQDRCNWCIDSQTL